MPTHRTARRLLALLLAAVLGGGAGLRALEPCPHHAGSSGGAVHGVAGPGHAQAPGEDRGHVDGPDAGDDPCTCVGTCHATAAAPLPVPGGFSGPSVHESLRSASPSTPRALPAADDPYLIPFANGPPASLSG